MRRILYVAIVIVLSFFAFSCDLEIKTWEYEENNTSSLSNTSPVVSVNSNYFIRNGDTYTFKVDNIGENTGFFTQTQNRITTVDITKISGSKKTNCGIIFFAEDDLSNNTFTAFLFNPDKEISIKTFKNARSEKVLFESVLDSICDEYSKPNRISVRENNSLFEFRINNTLAGSFSLDLPSNYKTGFIVLSSASCDEEIVFEVKENI